MGLKGPESARNPNVEWFAQTFHGGPLRASRDPASSIIDLKLALGEGIKKGVVQGAASFVVPALAGNAAVAPPKGGTTNRERLLDTL